MLEKVKFPELVGVDSDVVKGYIEFMESKNMQMDSLMVIKDGKVACETYWYPNDADVPHDMYSLSKSITGLAVGIAVDEGLIDLDTKVYPKYFPEKLSKFKGKQLEYANKLTVHDVIAMKAGKVTSVLDNKQKAGWIDTFMDAPFKYEPGTEWKYVSENAYLLSYIIQKESGQTMTEYLTPRLYEPLGIEVPQWDQSHEDIDAGGWGLKLKTMDIAKISQVFLGRGMYGDKKIFSEKWYDLCTYPYEKKTYPIFTDKTQYGYQIWIDNEIEEPTLRFVGLYGQFSFMFPKHNAAVIITARDNRDENFIQPVFKFFPRAFINPVKKENKEKTALFDEFMSSRKFNITFPKIGVRNEKKEKEIENRTIKLKSLPNLSIVGTTTFFMWRDKCGELNNVRFNFTSDSVEMYFTEKNCGELKVEAGFNGVFKRNYLKMCENTIVEDSTAVWNTDGTLEIYFHNTGRAQAKRFVFSFIGNAVFLKTSVCPGHDGLIKFNIEFNNGLHVYPVLHSLIKCGTPVFDKAFATPDAVGKFVK